MSDVVEKTLTALPGLLLSLDSQPGAAKLCATSRLGSLVRSITELTSKNVGEEMAEPPAGPRSPKQMKEIMVRAIYCEMLGYEASFSYIHAIKLAQQGSVLEKRVGYLAVSLFLHESHDLLLLLVNTVLKDLQSTNLIEVCMALTVVSQIFPKDMIPAVLPLVEDKLTHSKEIIRRKAVLALYKFYLIAPNQVQHIHDKFRKALCDKDPGVMTASLHIYLKLIKESPESYKDLTDSFVTILKQVVGGKLPVDFNYHSVPAPWLQMQLLRILALLGKEDQRTSEMMYEVLDESLRRAEINHNITYAILYECLKTIYTIHPKSELLEKAAKCIGKFVLSPKINLKYLGLKALTYVVQQDPNLALQHQMTIIECLDHSDPIIKRETLELLYRITNGQNVSVIVEKMLDFLRLSKDEYTTIDLVGKVAELAEKYPFPYNSWFIQTMNAIFSIGGDVMQPDIPNNFLRLLAEGFDSDEEDRQLRLLAVDSYLSLLECDTSGLPQRFLQVISWVLGEFSFLKEGLEPADVVERLGKLLDDDAITTETRCWVLAAMSKLCGSSDALCKAEKVAHKYTSCLDTALRQQAVELELLGRDVDLRTRVLPQHVIGFCVWLQVDSSLSFLDGFVSDALARGAAPYKPPHQRQEELSQEKILNFEPYGLSLPVSLSACSLTDRQSPTALSLSSSLSGNSADPPLKAGSNLLKLEGVKRVWGKQGYLPEKQATEEALAQEPSSIFAPSHQQACSESQQTTFSTIVEQDQEKRQLASSLFVGLGSQNAPCLLGKPEASSSQRFRRKVRPEDPSDVNRSLAVSSSFSHSSSALDVLLDNAIPDPTAVCLLVEPASAQNLSDSTSEAVPAVGNTEVVEASEVSSLSGGSGPLAQPSSQVERGLESDLPSRLPATLVGLLRSDVEELCSGESLSLSACKVFDADALVLAIFLKGAEFVLFSLFVCFSLCLNHLYSEGVAQCQGWEEHLNLGEASLYHSVSPPASCSCRPLPLTTEEYGKMWLSFSHDVKQNLMLLKHEEEDQLEAALTALKEKLCLHIVDVIGAEGIMACQLVSGRPCLLHCHTHGGMLAIWLRSPIADLPDCLLYHCQKAIQER
uniref:AP-4 complex subunit epsilon n=1 Tax=Scleropages formosus TaxID=113540 RepID=A0A8C9SXZ6_SCLFO